jgi:hypothetical protein
MDGCGLGVYRLHKIVYFYNIIAAYVKVLPVAAWSFA